MIKHILKRLLEYCPKPSKPFTTTLKHYGIPITILLVTSVAAFSYFLLFSGAPMQPTARQMIPAPPLTELPTGESAYLPGVSVGDYVIYGNYVCNVSHPTGPEYDISCVDEMEWKKVEVIGVSGKEVILRYTEQLKNGSATNHSGCVHVIEDIEHPSWFNGSCRYQGYYFGDIVAANLTEGDSIHSSGPCFIQMHNVNETEIRTYLSAYRWVNIMKFSCDTNLAIWVFDMESGMLLEYEGITPDNERTSYNVVETNIFSSPLLSPTSSLVHKNTEASIPNQALNAAIGP